MWKASPGDWTATATQGGEAGQIYRIDIERKEATQICKTPAASY